MGSGMARGQAMPMRAAGPARFQAFARRRASPDRHVAAAAVRAVARGSRKDQPAGGRRLHVAAAARRAALQSESKGYLQALPLTLAIAQVEKWLVVPQIRPPASVDRQASSQLHWPSAPA